ncbi:hypothetical protein J7I44_16125 [Frateuria sp. MAH-13]|uniref:Phosphatidic acid phosphatase type 2/haloperoxidase domain-containing protein n=1 Tax=Frateuria flava TaxID=2821489 RepID=A0ABS4DSA2_9GAMM|nr:hypothetical protein [Frateuria flava]MBP1475828.1 hypothetical protein [Frateuria flava]
MRLPSSTPVSETHERVAMRPWLAIAMVVAAPLVLAIVEIFHPHPQDLFDLDVDRWMFVHYAQIPLFPLSALSIAMLVRDRTDWAAWLCKAGMFVFAVAFTTFDTAAGLVIGLLVKGALASGDPESWRDMIDALWFDPVLGGKGFTDAPLMGLIGRLSLSFGAVAGSISLKRAGHGWLPVLLLAVASFGINVFKSHSWPGGPLTFGGMALAAGWIRWESSRRTARAIVPIQADSSADGVVEARTRVGMR